MTTIFDLQFFADDGDVTAAETTATNETPETPAKAQPEANPREVKKYSDEDVDRMFNRRFAELQRQHEKKVAEATEAERLAKMTAEERMNEQMKQLQAEVDAYKSSVARGEMMREARTMLQADGIHVSDDLLLNIIAADAETTKANVDNFRSLFRAAVDAAVKERMKGETPKTGAPSGLTRAQIMSVQNRTERQRLIRENAHLFNIGG